MDKLRNLYDLDLLPDGSRFAFWDCETNFRKTYVVDCCHPLADDEGNGTSDHPFRTIAHAADIVQPGERILIRKGEYFETIRNIRGGTDSRHMILLEGEEGTVITGAISWDPGFVPSEGYRQTPVETEQELFSSDRNSYFSSSNAAVYMGDLPKDGSVYEYGMNPFLTMNVQTMAWVPKRGSGPKIMDPKKEPAELDLDTHLKKRGLLFMDGQRLEQVVRPFELWEKENVYWVDDTYKRIHVHLQGNEDPNRHRFELAVHEQAFMPAEAGLGYLIFRNITFQKFSNPFKFPQYGAVCSNCGHHFILENCRFFDINGVGLDLGFISHYHYHEGIRGWHIVRNCRFEHCGIGGLSAVPTQGAYLESMLVENNVLLNNGFHNAEMLYESAAIKSHYTRNSLYRNNYIDGMDYGCGIWLDKGNCNTRICRNTVLHLRHVSHGGIFNEATLDTVLIDHNLVADVHFHTTATGKKMGGNGIYEHECENTIVWENVVFQTDGDGIHFHWTPPEVRRFLGNDKDLRVPLCRDNIADGNLIGACRHGISLSSDRDASDGNLVVKSRISAFAIQEKGEHHNAESFRQCYGFEATAAKEDDLDMSNDGLRLHRKGREMMEIRFSGPAELFRFFIERNT